MSSKAAQNTSLTFRCWNCGEFVISNDGISIPVCLSCKTENKFSRVEKAKLKSNTHEVVCSTCNNFVPFQPDDDAVNCQNCHTHIIFDKTGVSYVDAKSDEKEVICKNCKATLVFKPGTTMMGCEFCGTENEIVYDKKDVVELDFEKYLATYLTNKSNTITINVVQCEACKAQTELKPNLVADHCDFCGNPIAVKGASTCTLVKPSSILPFAIEQQKAFDEFVKWVKGLWFAPNDLKHYANRAERLAGMYIPYWTYDSETSSQYTGMRGVNRTETYTVYVNGKTETRTRTRIDWYPASGYVDKYFDDVLVLGSKSLPKTYTESLEPWDLENLVSFDEKFLSGFKTESYQVDLKDGYDESKQKMDVVIRQLVKKHIGGDHQKITTLDTTHAQVTFKHILLPIWLSAFLYHNKSYRFMINGRTGEVQGERPYSAWKIVFFILAILAVIGGIIFLIMYFNK